MNEKTETKTVSIRTLLKSGFWYTVSNFLTRTVGFLTIPIFSRILTKAELGNYLNYGVWLNILTIICGIEVYNTLNRARFDYPEEERFDAYVSSCLVLSTILTGIVFGLYLLFPDVFFNVLLIDHRFMVFMFLYLFMYPAYAMFQIKQRITYRYKLSAGISCGLALASSVLAVLLAVHAPEDHLSGRIFGQYSLTILAGFAFYIYFLRKSISVRVEYIIYALRIGLPLVFSYLGSSILLSSDNFVVKHMCLDEQVGYIALIHSAAHIVLILVQTLNIAWAPWFYDKLKDGQNETIQKTYKVFVWMVVIATFLVLLLGPELVLILGGKDYYEAVFILPANILNGVFTALTTQLVNLETYYKKPEYAAVITGIVAVVNIGANILGVLLWDYRAVCYVTVVCNILAILIHYRCAYKMNVKVLLKPADLAMFISASLLLIPVSLILYRFFTLRIIVSVVAILAVLVVAWDKRERILGLVKRIRK